MTRVVLSYQTLQDLSRLLGKQIFIETMLLARTVQLHGDLSPQQEFYLQQLLSHLGGQEVALTTISK